LQKIVIFTYPGLHFLFALGTPLRQSRKTLHEWKTIQCLPNPSQHVPIYLEQFPSYSIQAYKIRNLCCFLLNSVSGSEKNRFWHVNGSEKSWLYVWITVHVWSDVSLPLHACSRICHWSMALSMMNWAIRTKCQCFSSSMSLFSFCVMSGSVET